MPVFKGNKSFYEYELTDILLQNVRSWLDYGLVEMGAYTPVKFDLPTSGYTTLKRAYDPVYGSNRIFEGIGASWVWESGMAAKDSAVAPFQVSGVYINNQFQPTSGVGQYSHIVDYKNGRIIFHQEISTSATVKCEYTCRDVGVYLADGPQWKTIVNNYLSRFEDGTQPSGIFSILKENRVWLPCVFISVPNRTTAPLQLGGGEIAKCKVVYTILSDRSFSKKRIVDTISNQQETVLDLFDANSIVFPLSASGTVVSGALTYPQLADRNSPYFWTFAFIEDSRSMDIPYQGDIFGASIIQSINIDRYLSTY